MRHLTKHITLKHLLIQEQKMIGLQFQPDKVIQALVKDLPNPRWSEEYGMVYLLHTKANLDRVFEKFRGVAWINGNSFFTEKVIRDNAPVDMNWFRQRSISNTYRYVPEVFLEKLELKRYAFNTCKTYILQFERFINYYPERTLVSLSE